MSKLLSKSKYMLGLQCPKLLWITVNKPSLLPEVDEATQHRFDQGHLVNEYAHKLFPSGIIVSEEDFMGNIKETKKLLVKRKPLFEAGILSGNLFSKADILVPVGKDEWDVIEVKSSTKVKEEHLLDVAFQKHVYSKSLKIRKCFLMHINNKYVKKGDIEADKLFVKVDITDELDDNVELNVKKILKILSLKKAPEFSLEDLGTSFYDNAMTDEFYDSLPLGSVFELYRGGKKCVELFGKKICNLVDIPEDYKLNDNQSIQKECAKTGKAYIDKVKIKEFLSSLKEPLYYLDFETFSTVIPLFDGVRPYQQVLFQYSLHVSGKHYSFLASDGDCRKEFISSLKKNLCSKGSIIVFNQSFEKGRLKELAEMFPEYCDWVDSVLDRIVDLQKVFTKFYYYSPKQVGSASLKNVLPALTGKSYSELEINNGSSASLEFMNITFGDMSKEEINKTRKNLEEYCGLDTEGMIWIIDELKKV